MLGPTGGVLEPFANITRFFLGGTIGNGDQYMSWMHVDDFNQMIDEALRDERYAGVINAVAPEPVTNEKFMRILRHTLKRPWSPRTPAWAVKIGTRFLGTEAELVLTGRRGIPKRLEQIGFAFQFPEFEGGIKRFVSS